MFVDRLNDAQIHPLFHFPKLAESNWRDEFNAFPWPPLDRRALVAWQGGNTGVPLVDAGMRELWHTGTMHNRVRMVVASFLTKNLLIDWREGERWFWDTLVDADEWLGQPREAMSEVDNLRERAAYGALCWSEGTHCRRAQRTST